jgi:hypothetical protein
MYNVEFDSRPYWGRIDSVADSVFNYGETSSINATRALKHHVVHTLRTHALFIAIVLVYVIAAYVTADVYQTTDRLRIALYSGMLVLLIELYTGAGVVFYGLYILFWVRPERPLRYVFDDIKTNYRRYFASERLLSGLLLILLLPPFMSCFGSFKVMIPAINPFSWDAYFAHLDLTIHGGWHPWQLLQPVLGYPLVTFSVNFVYNLWFLIMFGVFFWQAISFRNPRLRMQYLLTFQLSWILLGTVAAIAFSSGGPCFYGRLVNGPDIYEPLMKYLWTAKQSYPLWALDVQEELWAAYQNKEIAPLLGITAMPSMHVSSAFLFALVGWRTNRWIGIPLTIVAIMVGLGCVHLGWHYGVDAYAAVLGTWLIWWVVGRVQRVLSSSRGVR